MTILAFLVSRLHSDGIEAFERLLCSLLSGTVSLFTDCKMGMTVTGDFRARLG